MFKVLSKLAVILLFVFRYGNAQQLVSSFTIANDTSQTKLAPVVWLDISSSIGAYAVANGGVYDIYDMLTGKIASIPINAQGKVYSITPYILYANSAWLLYYQIVDTTGVGITKSYKYSFKVYNGTSLILTDSATRITYFVRPADPPLARQAWLRWSQTIDYWRN